MAISELDLAATIANESHNTAQTVCISAYFFGAPICY